MSLHEAITAHRPAPVTVPKPVTRLRLGVSWPTIILFAVVISYVSGFWVTSLQGAIGSLDRSQPPFGRWLRDSTLMLPLYVVAILVAVLLARRWFGNRRTAVRVGMIALLIIAACTFVGVAEVANSSAYDYQLQTQHIDLVDGFNHGQHTATPTESQTDACVGVCAAKQSTLGLHIRAVTYASALLLITNILLVVWLLAVGGDRLWKRSRPNHTDGQQP